MKARCDRSAGVSLIECLVAISVAAILMLLAAPGLTAYKRNAELTSAANRLLSAVQAARGEAMKKGVTAMLVPAAGGSDWSAGWLVFLDLDGKQAPAADGTGVLLSAGPLPPHLRLEGSGIASGATPYVMFNPSGYSRTKSGAFGALAFTLTRVDLDESSPQHIRKIVISSVGRARVCRPANDKDADCSDGRLW